MKNRIQQFFDDALSCLAFVCLGTVALIATAIMAFDQARMSILKMTWPKRYQKILAKREQDEIEWKRKFPYHEM